MSSLTFTANANSGVDCGSDSSLEDLASFTIASWIYPTSLVADDVGRVFSKGAFGVGNGGRYTFAINHTGNHVAGSLWMAQKSESGTNLLAYSTAAEVTVNTWSFIATTGSTTAPKLYEGTLATAVTEITGGYGGQTAGTDVILTDAGNDVVIGNWAADNHSFPGYIAWVGVWNRILTLAELKTQQFRPHVTSGCKGFWWPGLHGAAACPDLSGNGNNGVTFTNVSVAQGAPVGLLFGADDVKPPYTVTPSGVVIFRRRRESA
jgi:hypothetical protein